MKDFEHSHFESGLDMEKQKEKIEGSSESLEEKIEKQIKEICREFDKLTEKEYVEVRRLSDEEGLYLYEVEFAGSSDNKKVMLQYLKEGNHGKNASLSTEISKIWLVKSADDKYEVEFADQKVRFVNGEWVSL